MNGHVENTNRAFKQILDKTVGQNRREWSYKLDDALWAFRTAFKAPLETTPFRLVCGKACHLPVELGLKAYWALKSCNMDLTKAIANRFLQIIEFDELRLDAYESSITYKERMKRWHDKRIKTETEFMKGVRIESKGSWDTSEYCDTADSGRKKETKSFTFYRMETEEVSEKFAIKLCLDYKVKNGEKVVKRELLFALRGELYFVKFIINLEQDGVEPGVVFGRSFLKITKGIVDFGNGILTIYLDLITFNDDSDDELDELLAIIDVSDLPTLDVTDIPPFMCRMVKGARNKKQLLKNYKMSYNGE
ncbi:DNA-directed DNA polymerase [Tanacetum coccineum]